MRVVNFFGFLHLHVFFFWKSIVQWLRTLVLICEPLTFLVQKQQKTFCTCAIFQNCFFFLFHFSEFFFGCWCYLNFELTNDTRVLSENSLSLMSWSVFFNHSVFVDNRETFWCVCDPGNFLNSLSLWLLKVGLVGLWQELLSWFVDKPLKWVRGTRIWPT